MGGFDYKPKVSKEWLLDFARSAVARLATMDLDSDEARRLIRLLHSASLPGGVAPSQNADSKEGELSALAEKEPPYVALFEEGWELKRKGDHDAANLLFRRAFQLKYPNETIPTKDLAGLGRVDGFQQDEAACESDDGSVVFGGLLAS